MRTGTQIFTTLAVTTLGVGATLMAASSAHAAPATGPTPTSACQALGGSYDELDGDWYCQHPVRSEIIDPTLTAVCYGAGYYAYVIDDGNPTGTVSFTCYF